MYKNINCQHKRFKRIYTYGYKSKPIIKCKDCNKVIKKKDLPKKQKWEQGKNNY